MRCIAAIAETSILSARTPNKKYGLLCLRPGCSGGLGFGLGCGYGNTSSCCFFRASSVERFISNLSSNFLQVFRKIRKVDLKACMIHVWFGGLYKYRSARPSYRTDFKIVEGAGAWPNHTSEPRQAHSSVRWQRVGSLGMANARERERERERESTQLGIQAGI